MERQAERVGFWVVGLVLLAVIAFWLMGIFAVLGFAAYEEYSYEHQDPQVAGTIVIPHGLDAPDSGEGGTL